MSPFEIPSLDPSPWLRVPDAGLDETARNEVVDVPALFKANIDKMHHQQRTAQSIRTWSFAFVAFLLGSSYVSRLSIAITSLVLSELILLVILLREIDWHRMFWKYRDRARICEAYLLGLVDAAQCRQEYVRATDKSRVFLLKDAFSPKAHRDDYSRFR